MRREATTRVSVRGLTMLYLAGNSQRVALSSGTCGAIVLSSLQIMVKGKGIFVNPASNGAPAKLRVLYEVGPIAYLIEKAGGKSSDGENSALDIKIPHTEVRHE